MADAQRRYSLKDKEGILILTSAILASGIGFLMSSSVNIALPTIQRVFAADVSAIQWIVNAYVLFLGGLILTSGALGDKFGIRRIYELGIGVFTLGALLCGLAWSIPSLLVARSIQGTGAAFMVPGSLAVIRRVFREDTQGKAIGLWAGISGAIAGLGPFIGGFLTGVSWRLLFFSVLPLGIAALAATRLWVPALRDEEAQNAGIDLPGTVLNIAGLFSLTFALIRIPERGMDLLSTAGLMIGIIAVAGFIVTEFHREKQGRSTLVRPSMFNRTVGAANLSTLFLYFAFQGVLFLLSLNLQQLQGFAPSTAGLLIMPATILIPFLSGPSGSATDKYGPAPQLRIGPALFTAGAALLLFGGKDAGYLSSFLPGLLVLGLGMVTVIPAITRAALLVEDRFSGAASGVNNAAARIAGLFAVAAAGGILASSYRVGLAASLSDLSLSGETVEQVLGTAGRLLEAPLPDGVSETAREAIAQARQEAYAGAYRLAMGVNIAAAGASALLGWIVPGKKAAE